MLMFCGDFYGNVLLSSANLISWNLKRFSNFVSATKMFGKPEQNQHKKHEVFASHFSRVSGLNLKQLVLLDWKNSKSLRNEQF